MQKNFFSQTISGFLTSFMLAVALVLTGCGGAPSGSSSASGVSGGGTSSSITQTLAATVATGSMVSGASVTVKDSSATPKTVSGTTSASGQVSLNVTGMTAPLMIVASSGVLPQPMYSVVPVVNVSSTASTTGTVDVTPITTLALYNLNNGVDPGIMYLLGSFSTLTSATAIKQAALNVRDSLLNNSGLTGTQSTKLSLVPTSFDLMGYDGVALAGSAYDTALDYLGAIQPFPVNAASGVTLVTTPSALNGNLTATTTYSSSAVVNLVTGVQLSTSSNSTTVNGASGVGSYVTLSALVNGTNTPVAGQTVTFAASAGTLSSSKTSLASATNTATTNSSGVATLYLIAPPTVGSATITATIGAYTSNIATVNFNAGAPAYLGVNAAPNAVLPSGASTLTAAVVDVNGNPVSGALVTFSLPQSPASGGAKVGQYGFTPLASLVAVSTNSSGLALASYNAGTGSGTDAITVSVSGANSQTASISVSPNSVVVGAVTVTADSYSILASGSSSATIYANIGQQVSGVPVTFSTTAGTLSSLNATTNTSGIASVTLTSGTTATAATVTAVAHGISGSSPSITFAAGTPAVIGVNAAPSTVNPGGFSTISAAVLDNNGNPVPNEKVTFSFATNNSGSTVLGATGTTNGSGIATVNYYAGAHTGTDTIQASVTGASGAITNTTGVTVSNASLIVGSVTATTSSNSIPVTVTGKTSGSATISASVKTAAGAPVPGIEVDFTVSDSNSTILPASAVTDATGTATSLLTSGPTELVATVTASAGGFSSNTTVTYTSGAANAVSVSSAPATVKPGGSSAITALVTDANGNPVTGETVTFAFAANGNNSGGTLGSVTAVTNINGLASVTYTAGGASGTDTITATASTGKHASTSVQVSNNAIVVGAIAVTTGTAILPTGGSCTPVTATVTDNSGVAASGVSVYFTTDSGTMVSPASVPASSVLAAQTGTSTANIPTDSNGRAVEYLCSGSNLGTATVTADASGFANTATVNFIANAPANVSLVASPSSLNAGNTSTIGAIVTDAQGNPVVGQTVTFAFTKNGNNSGAQLGGSSTMTAVTNANGVATATYTAGTSVTTIAVTDTVTATLANTVTKSVSISVAPSAAPAVATIILSASPSTIKTDDITSTTVTVTALSATNTLMSNVQVSLSSQITTDLSGLPAASGVGGGSINAQGSTAVTTNNSGQATVTFSSGPCSTAPGACQYIRDNRTVTITATATAASGISALLPVQITGSTVTANSTGSSVTTAGSLSPLAQTLTFTAKDAGGNLVTGVPIAVTQASNSGGATVTLNGSASLSGVTDSNGQYAVTVAGGSLSSGTVTVTATALGTTVASGFTVTGTPFGVSEVIDTTSTPSSSVTANPTAVAMKNSDYMIVVVNAPNPPTANVLFANTVGAWVGGTTNKTVAVGAGTVCNGLGGISYTTLANQACAVLTVSGKAGLANVQVTDPSNSSYSASFTVSVTSATAATLTLQPSPAVVPKSSGVSTLIATVTDSSGLPVGGAPVTFSIVNPTGGGENVSPVVAYTATTATNSLGLGQALATFTAGSQSSGAQGVQIQALSGAASGVAEVVIGGTAASVSFARATTATTTSDNTSYILNMSALVADANGNPVPSGTVVNISSWPIAWSTGSNCAYDLYGASKGTFYNEDINENLVLDSGEDGLRLYYSAADQASAGENPAAPATWLYGTTIGYLIPPSAAAGVVQSSNANDLLIGASTVTTDANGMARFTLTYPKNSALYIVDRIRATTVVQGSEAVGQVIFRLPAVTTDISPTCLLPPSPYGY